MTRLKESTKHAERTTWPAVKEVLAAQATPVVVDKLMRTRQSRSNARFIVEETIQAIAAAGLLRTPADADVIGKAVNWHDSWIGEGPPDENHDDPLDVELYAAVETMLAETKGRPRP